MNDWPSFSEMSFAEGYDGQRGAVGLKEFRALHSRLKLCIGKHQPEKLIGDMDHVCRYLGQCGRIIFFFCKLTFCQEYTL